ncbi:Predicted nucleotide-utilizing enzyme [Formivibrio citricus]|uniref:Predicted nucleotide-utilizing enzyme n=1 Tax=Formivibrio citricus TaxID=83765 RepID=A0A1I5CMZ7_9NEIS|nr:molybdopterin-binding protein [Formivibrio citricus]SFN88297.1 Predicted nucleotide-utilizing enzyme [Formivibrio citricus]
MAEFQLFIIGDEILSGRRQDQHFPVMLQKLKARGHKLAGARYLPDHRPTLVEAFRLTLAARQKVISCGGIGGTPDDHTRQALAEALELPLVPQPEALRIIETKFGDAAYPHRARMAEFPQGAELVPNPVNQIAGCSIREHYLLPGFPEMAWPMADWLLDTYYPAEEPPVTRSIISPNAKEGDLIDAMEALTQRWPDVAFSSLPSFGNNRHPGLHIEFSVTGTPEATEAAMHFLQEALAQHGLAWSNS